MLFFPIDYLVSALEVAQANGAHWVVSKLAQLRGTAAFDCRLLRIFVALFQGCQSGHFPLQRNEVHPWRRRRRRWGVAPLLQLHLAAIAAIASVAVGCSDPPPLVGPAPVAVLRAVIQVRAAAAQSGGIEAVHQIRGVGRHAAEAADAEDGGEKEEQEHGNHGPGGGGLVARVLGVAFHFHAPARGPFD